MDSATKIAAATKRTEMDMPALAPPERELSATGGVSSVFVGAGVVVAVSMGDVKAEEVLPGGEACGALMPLDIMLGSIEVSEELSETIEGAGVVSAVGVGVALEGIALELKLELELEVELMCVGGTHGETPTAIHALMTFCVALLWSS